MVNADELKLALDATTVLESQGIDFRVHGDELRTNQCPACGQRNREAISVNADTGLWRCFRCLAHGDVYDLIAGFAGFDIKREFLKVLALARAIAGVGDEIDPAFQQLLAERQQLATERRAAAAEKRARARARMPQTWAALMPRHAGGEAYLRDERRIDPAALRMVGPDVLRYSSRGEPAVAVRDLETGAIVGIQQRRVLPGEPKTPVEPGSQLAGSALHGRIDTLDADGVDVAVLVEGLSDTLAALLAFPGCAVFGAPGHEHLETITQALAPRIAAIRGWLLMVPDDDEQGARSTAAAIQAAQEAGLRLAVDNCGIEGASTIRLVDLGTHHDLADAWRSGWRWTWPRGDS